MTSTRTYDRVPSRFHPKMLAFTVESLTHVDQPRSYTWALHKWLDQGQEGACVGFGWTHDAAAKPDVWDVDNATALALYHDAQVADEWPGTNYEGTSVNAGAIVSRARGWISAWFWAKDAREVVLAIGHHGPVIIGVDWWSAMEDPDAGGWIHVGGSVVGGHCTLLRGVRLVWKRDAGTHPEAQPDWWDRLDRDRSYFLLHNSWGKTWGVDGTAKLSLNDMQALMDKGGEAALPARLPVSRKG